MNLKKTQNTKISKQAEQKQNHRYGDHLEGYQLRGKERGQNEEKEAGTKKYKLEGTE